MEKARRGSWAFAAMLAAMTMLAAMMTLAIALACAVPVAYAELTQLEDGEYEVPVTLEGGTGRASIASPATVRVADGQVTATIVWSSSNYDKMTVAKAGYAPTTTEGGSTFEIPVTDDEMKVKAETTAMGTPHTISYTIVFDMASAQAVQAGGGVSMGAVAVAIVVLLAIGIVLGVVASRRKARR